jgi:7-cyano-7-deazaguanine synthase
VKRAVVLLSGGLDSATVVAIAQSQGFSVSALTINYGQRHRIELECAEKVALRAGVERHLVMNIPLTDIGGSALTDSIEVPKNSPSEGIPVTYVPARNTVFLSLALGFAEVLGANDIFCGVNAVDYSGYPDCRPEFVEAFENLANVATKAGVEGNRMTIHAPLLHLTKPEIIRTGLALGVDYSITHSCYDPAPNGMPCGECDSCQIRNTAFAEVEEPGTK